MCEEGFGVDCGNCDDGLEVGSKDLEEPEAAGAVIVAAVEAEEPPGSTLSPPGCDDWGETIVLTIGSSVSESVVMKGDQIDQVGNERAGET